MKRSRGESIISLLLLLFPPIPLVRSRKLRSMFRRSESPLLLPLCRMFFFIENRLAFSSLFLLPFNKPRIRRKPSTIDFSRFETSEIRSSRTRLKSFQISISHLASKKISFAMIPISLLLLVLFGEYDESHRLSCTRKNSPASIVLRRFAKLLCISSHPGNAMLERIRSLTSPSRRRKRKNRRADRQLT